MANSDAGRPRRRLRKALIIGCASVGTVALLLVAWVAIGVYPRLANLGYEYNTASVVRAVEEYVKTHDGEWPRSWADLDESRRRPDYTVVRFDLTADEILENNDLIYDAIRPSTGVYYTYPHARTDLERLLNTIEEAKSKAAATQPE